MSVLMSWPCTLRRLETARKRLAVPFRAAHQPSERSEYAQPDTALCLTIQAYYYDGLSLEQLLDALKVLLSLGQNAQRECYKEWLKMAAGQIPTGTALERYCFAVECNWHLSQHDS